MVYYAHSKENEPLENWQKLEAHLENVAKLAGNFASFFSAENWGSIAGKNHDIGKGTKEWQVYLLRVNNIILNNPNKLIGGINETI